MQTITIQPVSVQDAAALLAIYRPYVETTPISFELAAPTVEEFAQRIRHTTARFPYLKAVRDGEILGYTYVSPFRTRAAYNWSVETSIYVKQGEHAHGIGRMLYTALEAVLQRQHIYNLYAGIAYPNPESEQFHEHMGYQRVAHFKDCGYKLGAWRDMIFMERRLPRPIAPEPIVDISTLDLPAILAEAAEGDHYEA